MYHPRHIFTRDEVVLVPERFHDAVFQKIAELTADEVREASAMLERAGVRVIPNPLDMLEVMALLN